MFVWQWHVSMLTISSQRCLTEQAVTVSHAFCPCAPSSNLSIPAQHTLRILHKMCISRAALFKAHAERTCSVALLNTYHARISVSNSPQLDTPPMKMHNSVEERERERKEFARHKEWAKSNTNRHNTSWRKRRSHFVLT